MEPLLRPGIETRLSREYFVNRPDAVAQDILGRIVIRQFPEGKETLARIKEVAAWRGEEDSSAKTMKYAPGIIGISCKFGKFLIDIATESEKRPSCITLIALESIDGIIQGPGNVTKYLKVDRMFDRAPIDHPCLWIGGIPISKDQVHKRNSSKPGNCLGYFYYS